MPELDGVLTIGDLMKFQGGPVAFPFTNGKVHPQVIPAGRVIEVVDRVQSLIERQHPTTSTKSEAQN